MYGGFKMISIDEINRLQAENAELKAYKDVNEDFKTAWEELKAENERLEHLDEEINDFISDISTCGFKYDDRCPDNLDELQCCIEDLCNKFSNYKQTLQEIKDIAETYLTDCQGFKCDAMEEILQKITKEEEE
jgi:DNA repair ATPase RecN